MNWKFDSENNEWQYIEDETLLVRIIIIVNDENPVYKIKVKILFNRFILGKKKLNELAKKNNTWYKQKVRKFKTSVETEKYIEKKKNELEKYIKTLGL